VTAWSRRRSRSRNSTLNESLRIGPVTYVRARRPSKRGPILDESRFAGSYDETGRLVGIRAKRGARSPPATWSAR
jgi:hypothetical protein